LRVDLRYTSPYEAYGDLGVTPVVPQDYTGEVHGDVYDRFLVRVMEVIQSLDLLEKIVDGIPEGPITWEPKLPKVLASLKAADGIGWGIIEAPRGDDTHIVKLTKGEDNLTWWKVRAPTYSNAVSWPLMFMNQEIADAPLIINSIDPCISCMERILVSDAKIGRSEIVTKAQMMEKCREKTRRLMGA